MKTIGKKILFLITLIAYITSHAQEIKTTDAQEANEAIDTYNHYFKTSFTTLNNLFQDMQTRTRASFAAIKACQIGKYHYASISTAFRSSVKIEFIVTEVNIIGIESNDCHFKQNLIDPFNTYNKVSYDCKISVNNLKFFTSKVADTISNPDINNFYSWDAQTKSAVDAWSKVNNCKEVPMS